jgi:hypothetical protein
VHATLAVLSFSVWPGPCFFDEELRRKGVIVTERGDKEESDGSGRGKGKGLRRGYEEDRSFAISGRIPASRGEQNDIPSS